MDTMNNICSVAKKLYMQHLGCKGIKYGIFLIFSYIRPDMLQQKDISDYIKEQMVFEDFLLYLYGFQRKYDAQTTDVAAKERPL